MLRGVISVVLALRGFHGSVETIVPTSLTGLSYQTSKRFRVGVGWVRRATPSGVAAVIPHPCLPGEGAGVLLGCSNLRAGSQASHKNKKAEGTS